MEQGQTDRSEVAAEIERNLANQIKNGVDAYGIEPNGSMRTYSLKKHPELAGRVQETGRVLHIQSSVGSVTRISMSFISKSTADIDANPDGQPMEKVLIIDDQP